MCVCEWYSELVRRRRLCPSCKVSFGKKVYGRCGRELFRECSSTRRQPRFAGLRMRAAKTFSEDDKNCEDCGVHSVTHMNPFIVLCLSLSLCLCLFHAPSIHCCFTTMMEMATPVAAGISIRLCLSVRVRVRVCRFRTLRTCRMEIRKYSVGFDVLPGFLLTFRETAGKETVPVSLPLVNKPVGDLCEVQTRLFHHGSFLVLLRVVVISRERENVRGQHAAPRAINVCVRVEV